MKYSNHILLIIAGIVIMFLRVINYINIQALNVAFNRNEEIVNGVVQGVEVHMEAWTYTPLPIIIGLLLIASGVLGIVKEMKAND